MSDWLWSLAVTFAICSAILAGIVLLDVATPFNFDWPVEVTR